MFSPDSQKEMIQCFDIFNKLIIEWKKYGLITDKKSVNECIVNINKTNLLY